ncbi:ACT domain-containing protein [Granulicatella seriolae]|uniref:UPF0237 protein NPA36_02610 n=1 Tax=Granulicatella seriolae TaxID=2967226 RepID=A0ABT1WMP4_9LACT|nr:ACT domain-containing protein [Granulicatella seriolae]
MRAIISVTGKNHPGIVAAVSTALSDLNVDIMDISQTIMEDFFTMILLGNLATSEQPLGKIIEVMNEVGVKQAVTIRVQSEEIFAAMHTL